MKLFHKRGPATAKLLSTTVVDICLFSVYTDTDRRCGAGSMQLPGVRPSVRPFVIFKTAVSVSTTQRHVTWPTSACRRRLQTVVASLALQSPRSWLLVPWTRTSTGQRSFAAFGPRTWSRLPTAIRSPELSLASFKRQLKTHSSVPVL